MCAQYFEGLLLAYYVEKLASHDFQPYSEVFLPLAD
jgi:hypothetical protein